VALLESTIKLLAISISTLTVEVSRVIFRAIYHPDPSISISKLPTGGVQVCATASLAVEDMVTTIYRDVEGFSDAGDLYGPTSHELQPSYTRESPSAEHEAGLHFAFLRIL
jgi:hypothetical protein